MSNEVSRIHISDFCHRLYRQAKAEQKRLAKNPDDVYDGFDEQPRPLDAVADYLSRRIGLKLEDVLTYIHRAGRGSHWGIVKRRKKRRKRSTKGRVASRLLRKRANVEVWPDISHIAQRMSAFNNTPDMDELRARFSSDYPREAAEMGLLKPAKRQQRAKWLAEAMLLVRDHPEWSDAKIARCDKVDRHPSRLSRSSEYQRAAAMARGEKTDQRTGFDTSDPDAGTADVEAHAPQPGDPIPGSRFYRGRCPECGTDTRVETREQAKTVPCERCQ